MGVLGPDQFIEIAEETGLIVPLGAWVLQEACLQAKRFQERAPRFAELTMSVNLSGAQLGHGDLVGLIASSLAAADLKAAHLQLEMTESVLMDDAAATVTILHALKALGAHALRATFSPVHAIQPKPKLPLTAPSICRAA
jgi:EAL domain-containing protein (putative c-di-GMP-specific phosphodiesterase class I)